MQQTIAVRTAQQVHLEYPIASVGSRILAALIDIAILFAYFIAYFQILDLIREIAAGNNDAETVLSVIFVLPFFFYHLLCETFLGGQSLGKKAMKIRVIRTDGSPARFGDYFLRWLIGIVELQFSLGAIAFLTVVINGRGQRLGDLAAGTCVVLLEREDFRETVFTELPEEYRPTFPQAARLNDRDAALIREVLALQRERRGDTALLSLDAKLRHMLEIRSELPPLPFVATLLRDYNYYTSQDAAGTHFQQPGV